MTNHHPSILLLFMMLLSSPIIQAQRTIAFEGIENARDMGGLVMQNGRVIHSGMLIRCGNLSQASDADVAVLKDRYRLTDVFDFRFEEEAAAAPDRLMDGVCYTHLSTLPKAIIDGFSSGSVDTKQMDMKDMAALLMKYAFEPKAQTMARQLYPTIVTDTLSQHYYGKFLRGVLHAKGGVLWHCSQGKDRAGWASAFLLAALGASRDMIVQDFDLSNQSYASYVEPMSTKIRQLGGDEEAVAFIRAIVGVSRENFEKTLDLIDQRYGSLSQYVENQLGFSKGEQQELRKKYLDFL